MTAVQNWSWVSVGTYTWMWFGMLLLEQQRPLPLLQFPLPCSTPLFETSPSQQAHCLLKWHIHWAKSLQFEPSAFSPNLFSWTCLWFSNYFQCGTWRDSTQRWWSDTKSRQQTDNSERKKSRVQKTKQNKETLKGSDTANEKWLVLLSGVYRGRSIRRNEFLYY